MDTHADFSIAPATPADVDAIAPLFDAYRQFYKQATDLPKARAFLRERLRQGESHVFVARELSPDRAPIAFMQLYPLFSSTQMRRAWVLNDLFVTPVWRRRGVARALLLKARDFARDSNAAELFLETAKDNEAAQGLYEELGWEREAVFVKYNLNLP
ncbi:MAG TPA: GNAT family N-acetyltransferase [Candidatus Eremiobacteraceae bacterium]|nr:GNAT family N-acetyltransferase [Candidatus Eremiobacteraceae bacterium]